MARWRVLKNGLQGSFGEGWWSMMSCSVCVVECMEFGVCISCGVGILRVIGRFCRYLNSSIEFWSLMIHKFDFLRFCWIFSRFSTVTSQEISSISIIRWLNQLKKLQPNHRNCWIIQLRRIVITQVFFSRRSRQLSWQLRTIDLCCNFFLSSKFLCALARDCWLIRLLFCSWKHIFFFFHPQLQAVRLLKAKIVELGARLIPDNKFMSE